MTINFEKPAIETPLPPGYRLCRFSGSGFAQLVGPLFVRDTERGPRFAFRAEAKHANPRDVLHGGMLMTFADHVLGLTVQHVTGSMALATVNLNCDFVAAVRPGDFIEGEAKVTRQTKSLVFITGRLFRGDSVVMTASGLWARLSR